jgi:hypothetical protein
MAQDEDGWTALIAASCYDHQDVVKVLCLHMKFNAPMVTPSVPLR